MPPFSSCLINKPFPFRHLLIGVYVNAFSQYFSDSAPSTFLCVFHFSSQTYAKLRPRWRAGNIVEYIGIHQYSWLSKFRSSMSTVGGIMLRHTKINSRKFPTLSPVCRTGNRKIRIKTQKRTNPGIAKAIFGSQRRSCYSLRSRRLEVVGRKRERARAPVFSCAHYFQAPATQAIAC